MDLEDFYLKPIGPLEEFDLKEIEQYSNHLFRFFKQRYRDNVTLNFEAFEILRETPKCYIIRAETKERRVLKKARKAFAYKDWRFALNSFCERRRRYMTRLETAMQESKVILPYAEKILEQSFQK